MKIPLVDLSAQYERLRADLLPNLDDAMRRAHFILGAEVELFEEEFAQHCGAQHCVSVSSGTEALHLALRAADVGPGDEVITAANSFVSTGFAITYAGASPVFVDVDSRDYNVVPELVAEAITNRTKAILPVHLYGQPARMNELLEIAARHGLKVIQDACQAHGALYQQQRLGALGDASCYSFYPGKNLGAFGDGGAVVTNDAALADELRLLRNYGQRTKNVHEVIGYNSRLDTLQAVVLLIKLAKLDAWNDRRRVIASLYRDLLSASELGLPCEHDDVRHVYHLFVVQHPQRDELLRHMQAQEIGCGIHYPTPLPLLPVFGAARALPRDIPVAAAAAQRIVSLPIYPDMTDEQVRQVAQEVITCTPARVDV